MSVIIKLAVFCLIFSWTNVRGCVDITGIGNDTTDIYPEEDLSMPDSVFFGFPIVLDGIIGRPFELYETPMQFRFHAYEMISSYSTLAAYDDTALEFFARDDIASQRRFCQATAGDTDSERLFNLHRSVALAYAYYFWYYFYLPEGESTATDILAEFGLDAHICDDPDSCSDTSTPWGLAYAIGIELYEFSKTDGWNFDGSLNREYNKLEYSDFRDDSTKYTPVNDPWDLKHTDRWQPLLESDSKGFLFHQEHVVPFVGYTGKSFLFDNDEICSYSSYEPDYDYDEEITLALGRLAALTDRTKMDIEYFDVKTNVFAMHGQFQSRSGNTPDSFAHSASKLILALSFYEGGLVVWKEKTRFDKVRPPSIVHKLLGDEFITSYAGVSPDGESYGTQTFAADNWEPFIRTMPHSEYPSASACVCEATLAGFIEYFGTDNVTGFIGGSLVRQASAYSSTNEPLSTPANDELWFYDNWTDYFNRCGDSRLEGGMHFTESVTAGQALCHDIGTKVAERVRSLVGGNKPDFVVDIYDTSIVERDCYPDSGSSDSDSSD